MEPSGVLSWSEACQRSGGQSERQDGRVGGAAAAMAEARSSSEETLLLWERQQTLLKDRLITTDTESWQRGAEFSGLERVGGVDLSFIKGNDTAACASLVVLSYPQMEVIYEDCHMVTLDAPYVAGFLAFREVPSLVDAVKTLEETKPHLMPQVLLVDGNGVLHHRGFGVACHLGILTNLPTIGVAKNLLQVDGLENNEAHKEQAKHLENGGEFFHLMGSSGQILGAALKSCKKSTKPVYVSVGHKISLETAVNLVRSCCKFRVPEPIRQADIRSREFLRKDQEQKQTEPGSAPVCRSRKKTEEEEESFPALS